MEEQDRLGGLFYEGARMALGREIIDATVAAANERGMNPAALLAVVEIESGGKPYEADGKTPRFLFERHKFYSELDARAGDDDLKEAVDKGLAHKDWRRTTQYADQGKSAERMQLLERASAVNQECAYRACSWGLGQTMGFHAERLGYPSAVEMVEAMKVGGVRVQIDCMVKEILRNRLEVHLAKRDWAKFARGYNGPRYEENDYDGKLARAYAHWAPVYAAQGSQKATEDVMDMGDSGALIKAVQERLKALGYPVGKTDGKFGSRTRSAVLSFQAENGLVTDGVVGPSTRVALNAETAKRMPLGERLDETKEDLKASGSTTIANTDKIKTTMKAVATVTATTGAVKETGLLDAAHTWLSELTLFKTTTNGLVDIAAWAMGKWYLFVLLGCYLLYKWAKEIELSKLISHRLGFDLTR